MKELSLNILDLARNSLEANSTIIQIIVVEDINNDLLSMQIKDNGKGMERKLLENASNPFITTRKTRKVGLGLSMAKEVALHCDGSFNIKSVIGTGTEVSLSFKHSHIDRPPLGDMGETILTLVNVAKDIDILYKHVYNNNEFVFDTREIKKFLGKVEITEPQVLIWIYKYINENIKFLYVNV